VSINNGGAVVFGATLTTGGRGFFAGPDPVADKVIAIGDALSGSTVVGFPTNAMNPRALNNGDQFLFRATLADGRTVLVRADPEGQGHDGGYQGEGDFLAPSRPTASLTGSPVLAASPASTLAFPPPALALGDVERLDRLFATQPERGTMVTLPKPRRDPLSFADEVGVDVVA
jgi:hypothetical protein